MAKKGRGIRALKKEYEGRSDEYNQLAKKATEMYSRSDPEYSQEQVAENVNVTVSCLRDLMDYAIVESIVSRNIAEGVVRKSVYNQKRKHPDAGATSIKHHQDLIKKREENRAEKFDSFDIDMIIYDILSDAKDVDEVIAFYKIESRREYSLIIERAIIENFTSDMETDLLIQRSFIQSPTYERVKCLREIIEKRIAYKMAKEEQKNAAEES